MAQAVALQAAVAPASRSSAARPFTAKALAPLRPARAEARQTIVCAAATAEIKSLGPDRWNDTYYPSGSDAANVHKQWYVIDAEGQTLGRVASLAAYYIRGKHLPTYTPSMDMGAYVVIVNAEKVAVTGRKETDKFYFRHTNGRPGGGKMEALRDLRQRLPERILEKCVKGMLPKGRIASPLFNHLKVYKGAAHPHEAQRPVDITSRISKKPAEAL
ncbi:50S ribosomal chloroplastic [Chlorella sorokiniana]|jgi:large subunit ribosomal protein L13|uniref:50S ribosomal chloroplastic n=1 Tax=Chlorella sorokiniana TaxID=3076 RepID=A0A2P6TDW9_CHLSO|nr:50S ribosomal chloroplastic [Chlorella sorokiniana]|eukprot:PRW20835.1 50S ribosomal chloroplastic [Chlorella sorokiniana]